MNWPGLLGSKTFIWLVLPALWAMTYLPNLGLRDLKGSEGLRATPAREMVESGNFVVPTMYHQTYLRKPPVFVWVIVAFGELSGGVGKFSARLPSALAALIGAWVLVASVRRELPRSTRALAGLMLLSGFVMLDKGTQAEIESLLCLLVYGAIAVWWRGWSSGNMAAGWFGSGVLMGAAVMTKG